VTKNTNTVLHTNVLRAKAEHNIKCYIFFIIERQDDFRYQRRIRGYGLADCGVDDLLQLLRETARLTAAKSILTYDKVMDVWERNGPVAAKLFTWVRNLESSVSEYPGRAFTELRSVTLNLPSCGKSMVINTSYYNDYSLIHGYSKSRIHVNCGDLDVESEGFFTPSSPEDYMSWNKEVDVSAAVRSMKRVIDVLQKELGETVPPITDHFFIWLCYFFPDKFNLLEESRLGFTDPARNTKPSDASVQATVDDFHKDVQIEANLHKVETTWNHRTTDTCKFAGEFRDQSQYAKSIVETVHILAQRSETKILERLTENASRFHNIASYYDLQKLPRQLLRHLILRTSLEASTYKPAPIANKCVESRVFFKCLGRNVMKVYGSMRGVGAGYPIWDKVELEVTLPDGMLLELEGPLQLEILSPVTELLQECVNQAWQGTGRIPEISDYYTAVYFLHALQLSEASDIAFNSFDRLIPLQRFPESGEEESDYESYYDDSPQWSWTDDDHYNDDNY